MIGSFLNTSIKHRVYALILIIFLGTGWAYAISAYYITSSLYEARYEQTRRLVETVHSMLKAIEKEYKDADQPENLAKQSALSYLRRMRYDNKEYYWVNDQTGFMVYHPDPRLSGKPAFDIKDRNGKEIIKDIIALTNKDGEGRYSYFWPQLGDARLKVSYVKKFEPWGWIIGSGVFVEDVDLLVEGVQTKLALAMIITTLVAFIMAFLVGKSISRPILSLNKIMQRLAGGDLAVDLPEHKGPKEIRSMAQTVQVFLENARRIALLEAEQKESESMKTEFVSVVSHELRTPLTSIRGSLGLVVSGKTGDLPEKAQKLVAIAYSNCERLILLINDILDIDKIAAGNMRYSCSSESVNSMVSAAVDANRSYAEKYYVHFDFTPLSEDARIYVDNNRFQQVITNFLSNAAKFSPAGAKVDIVALQEAGNVRITVKDYGLGIPDEFKSRIFKKFSQADSSTTRRKGGTGLGLYISKQIIEQMGGRIGYSSKTGLGSCFWVEFPLSENYGKESYATATSRCIIPSPDIMPPSEPVDHRLPLILHIEPNEDFSQYLAALLNGQTNILRVETLADALLELRNPFLFSTIVLDLSARDIHLLPDLGRRVQEIALPILVLTALEPSEGQREIVPAVMIKSRVSEAHIIQTILGATRAGTKDKQELS